MLVDEGMRMNTVQSAPANDRAKKSRSACTSCSKILKFGPLYAPENVSDKEETQYSQHDTHVNLAINTIDYMTV